MMILPFCFCSLLLAFACIDGRWMNSNIGPYIPVFLKFRECAIGENGYDGSSRYVITFTRFNPYKRNELQKSSTNYTFSQPLNDSYWQRLVFDLWSNNEWKPNALILNYPSKSCSMMKRNRGKYFANVFKEDVSGGCVVPNGSYHILNHDPRMLSFPQLPYGRYRVLLTNGLPWRKGCMLCAYLETDIIPE
ncbi:uncharacterized protein LOC127750765 [Frankliniella occidentalis]|uniref:Uncharacterized protein LOC127750765 n=1 Tax=Frankliniella occidentalis TaxID=133901 RepID=A0A9C6XS90_FRAOC|nr:uncharacterized protein LOC127750765 [Frankliniella occidentalis]